MWKDCQAFIPWYVTTVTGHLHAKMYCECDNILSHVSFTLTSREHRSISITGHLIFYGFLLKRYITISLWVDSSGQQWFPIRNVSNAESVSMSRRHHGNGYDVLQSIMMTSSNGNIFRVTGPLCGEFTGPGEFPTQRPVTRSFDVSFDLRLNKRLSKQPWGWWFEPPSWSLWRHRNDCGYYTGTL